MHWNSFSGETGSNQLSTELYSLIRVNGNFPNSAFLILSSEID